MKSRLLALLVACFVVTCLLAADAPAAVVELLRTAADALAEGDAAAFLEHFDKATPGYAQIRDDVEALLVAELVASSIEIVKDAGDDQRRDLELDWLLKVGSGPNKRVIVKCRVERRGRGWKITRFEPVDFFRAR